MPRRLRSRVLPQVRSHPYARSVPEEDVAESQAEGASPVVQSTATDTTLQTTEVVEDKTKSFVRGLERELLAVLRTSFENLPEWEKDINGTVHAMLDVAGMNNGMMQVRNDSRIVLQHIEVQRSFVCCSQYLCEEMQFHDEGCMAGEEDTYELYEVTCKACEPLHPTTDDYGGKKHVHNTQTSGASTKGKSHSLATAITDAIQCYRRLRSCDDCGNLFGGEGKHELHPPVEKGDIGSVCRSCVLQELLTPTRRADCSICLESTTRFITLACGHSFHFRCIANVERKSHSRPSSLEGYATWMQGRACPNCRHVHTSLVEQIS